MRTLSFFYIDILSIILLFIVGFVGIPTFYFAKSFLATEKEKTPFLIKFSLLLCSLTLLALSDHILLFFFSWVSSSFLLARLMIYKKSWKESVASSVIAKKNFLLSSFFLACFLALLTISAGTSSIQEMISHNHSKTTVAVALLFLACAAITQSALLPFQGWLLSSLNSPTFVSAIMHAGVVNGGGVLLLRFFPFYATTPFFLDLLFCLGFISMVIGSMWKLVQSDVKRMLACSTVAQMGFLVMQCGLGLFPQAAAHLLFHSFFKSYLFLTVGNSVFENKTALKILPRMSSFISSLVLAAIGTSMFLDISGISLFQKDLYSL